MYGTFVTIDDRPAVRFERHLAHPIATVWPAVSEPGGLSHWFPGSVEIDGSKLRFEDGGMTFDGEVTLLEPPHRFEFTWGPTDELRIELIAADDGCLLRLTHLLGSRDQAARDAAGWHVCLDQLEEWLAGSDAADGGAAWRGHYEEYERRGLPTGAPVPDQAA